MGLLPHWKAAFLYTDPTTGQDVVIDLPAPLRDIRTRLVQRRYVEEALDGTRSVKTIGPAHYELIGRIRFIDAPDAVLSMLRAAANGAQLIYTEDVTDPHAKTYAAELIWDDAAIELGMDADLGKIGRGEVTVVLRSSVPWGALYAGPDVLFRYRAGEPLSAAGATFSRSSGATLIDRTGTLQEVGPHVPRITWQGGRPYMLVEPGTTNSIRNPRAEGAAVGEIGAGGSLPTHWSVVPRGLTPEVVALGEEDGLPYVDLRLHGVPDATADAVLTFAGTTEVATQPGETWTGSYYCRLVGGSMDGVSSIRLRVQERAGDGSFLAAGDVSFNPASAIRLGDARRTYTHTMAEPDVAYVRHTLSVFVTAGLPVDITLRIGGPQLELGSVATALTLPPEGMLAASTRARDLVRAAWSHGVISCTVLMAGISAGGDQGLIGTAGARLFQLGAGTSIMDRAFVIRAGVGDGLVIATLGNGTANVNSNATAIPIGHEYIRAGVLAIDTVARVGRVRLLQWHRETPGSGAWTDASAAWSNPLDVTPLLREGWQQQAITVGNVYSGSRPGRLMLSDFCVLKGSHWTLDTAAQRLGIA